MDHNNKKKKEKGSKVKVAGMVLMYVWHSEATACI